MSLPGNCMHHYYQMSNLRAGKKTKKRSEWEKERPYFKMLHLIEAIWFMYMTTVVLLSHWWYFRWLHLKWKSCRSEEEQRSLEHGWEEFGAFLPPPSVFASELKTLFLCQRDQRRLRSITCLQPHCLFDLLICYHHPHHYNDCYYYFVNLKPVLQLGYLESCCLTPRFPLSSLL